MIDESHKCFRITSHLSLATRVSNMYPAKLSVLFFLSCLSLHDFVPVPQKPQPYPVSSHGGHKIHAHDRKGTAGSSSGHHHHDHHDEDKKWKENESDSHSKSADEAKKHKHGSHWDNYGETEKIVKDKGHGYVKAFSWDREEIKKDKWGKKGGHYDEGSEKKNKSDRGTKHKSKSGHKKKSAKAKKMDHSVWEEGQSDDGYAGLTWHDLQSLQGLI